MDDASLGVLQFPCSYCVVFIECGLWVYFGVGAYTVMTVMIHCHDSWVAINKPPGGITSGVDQLGSHCCVGPGPHGVGTAACCVNTHSLSLEPYQPVTIQSVCKYSRQLLLWRPGARQGGNRLGASPPQERPGDMGGGGTTQVLGAMMDQRTYRAVIVGKPASALHVVDGFLLCPIQTAIVCNYLIMTRGLEVDV